MRTIAFMLALVVANSSWAADDAKMILERAMKAQGGAETLAKANAQSWKSKGKMEAAGQKLEYTATYFMLLPEKMRFDMKMTFGGMEVAISAATDGKNGWEQANGMVQDMPADKWGEFQHNVYAMNVMQLHTLTDKAYQLSTLPEITLDGKDLVGFKVAREGKREISLYFDKKTNLLNRARTKVVDEFQRREVTQESIISGWRDKDGHKVFDKLTILRDGKDFITEEFTEQTMNAKIDDKLFVKPEAKK